MIDTNVLYAGLYSASGDFLSMVSFSASQGASDRFSHPHTNSVVLFNATTSEVRNVALSMVGAEGSQTLVSLPPFQSSPPLCFVLIPREDGMYPFSWGDYNGTYGLQGGVSFINISEHAYHTEIIIEATNRWHACP